MLTLEQRARIAPAVEGALSSGWTPSALAAFTGANTDGVVAHRAARLDEGPPTGQVPPGGLLDEEGRDRQMGPVHDGQHPPARRPVWPVPAGQAAARK
jgi:hypothetical protein